MGVVGSGGEPASFERVFSPPEVCDIGKGEMEGGGGVDNG